VAEKDDGQELGL